MYSASRFEAQMEQRLADIVKYLKKEYKNVTGNSVSLKKEGEVDVRVESASRVHSWATVYQMYKIGGIDEVTIIDEASEDSLDAG